MIMYIPLTRMPFPRWYPQTIVPFFSLDDGVKACLFNGTIARQVKGPTFSDWRMMPNWVLSYNPGFVYVLLVCLLACFLINEICLTKFWKPDYVLLFLKKHVFQPSKSPCIILQNFIFLLKSLSVSRNGTHQVAVPRFQKGLLFRGVTSGQLTWQWNITIFNRKSIFKGSIFHCYVSLPECSFRGVLPPMMTRDSWGLLSSLLVLTFEVNWVV